MSPKWTTSTISHPDRKGPSLTLAAVLALLCFLLLSSALLEAQLDPGRSPVPTRALPGPTPEVTDLGPLPASEPMELTLYLALSDDQKIALDSLLADQINPSSPGYHQWLTPVQLGQQFGADDSQLRALTSWITAGGLSLQSVAPARNRLTLAGTAAQIQSAFAVDLHRFSVSGQLHFMGISPPSIPAEFVPLVASISGLDDLPAPHPTTVSSLTGASLLSDPLAALASLVDSNTSPVLTIATTSCSTDLSPSEIAAYRGLLQQANAQGITVLATGACASGETSSFPTGLAEVTALATPPPTSVVPLATIRLTPEPPTAGLEPRPKWQTAPGLPADGFRHEPDLETTSAAAFAQTVSAILAKTGSRQGNINAHLYALAPLPGLFTQPDDSARTPPGTWEKPTGLGHVDLQALLRAYASGSAVATTTSLTSNSYSTTYGQLLTLTSTITAASYGATSPSGTITFSSPTQGTLGSSAISSGGASLAIATLPVGTYNITAAYSGDSAYAASSSTSPVVVTVSIVNATITATVSPATNVSYGATATVTATVNLPSSTIPPTGNVTALFEGITGSTFSNTLSPNMGSNTATANIPMSVPPPGTYTVSVTCAGSTNFQCQTPVVLPFKSVMGNSNVTVSVLPAAPQAGQPISLTATVGNAGNGTGTYTFSGSVSFYDNGKLIATAPVATNQATTTKTLSGNATHNIVAIYTGDANWNTSTSTAAAVTPIILSSSLVLSSNMGSVASTLAGVNVVFTGTITTNVTNTAGPTGTVTFYDTFNGSVVQLGSPAVTVPNGPTASIALFNTTGLLAGAHSIYAIYSGDDNFSTATSPVLTLTIADYGLTMVPSTLTLTGGTSANVTLLLNISGQFAGTVGFGCTPPAGSNATCSFQPASLSSGGVTTMTINTTSATPSTSSLTSPQLRLHRGWLAGSTLSLASLMVFILPRRRRFTEAILVVLLTAALLATAGCGQVAGTPVSTTPTAPTNLGTPLGTTEFVITAAGSNGVNTSRHVYNYQVTVQ